MGIYDRDYYRDEGGSRFSLGIPRTIVIRLILINFVLWLVNGLFFAENQWLTGSLETYAGALTHPLHWYRFLTYGFVHEPAASHLFFNMLGLFFFGPEIETLYGRKEFLRLYLVLILAGGLAWAVINHFAGTDPGTRLLGASGAVIGVILLFCLNFPRRTILLMFVLPVPAWVLGVFIVGGDVWGALSSGDGPVQTAFSVHLTGAALAFLYFHYHANFGRLLEKPAAWLKARSRSRLRVFQPPTEEDAEEGQSELSERVDRILEKIHRQGEASLTRQERRILETASREYQRRRQHP